MLDFIHASPLELIHTIFVGLFVLAFPALREPFFTYRPSNTPSDSARPRGRQTYYDIIRGIAIGAVVIGHVTKIYPEYYANASEVWLCSIANFCRFAIPIFLISSSILLSPHSAQPGNLISFFRVKISRVLIPYALCVVVIGLYHAQSMSEIVVGLYGGEAAVPYYYIPILVQCYLLYPLLLPIRTKRWFLGVSLLISMIFLILPWRLGGTFFCGSYFFFFAYGLYHRERFLHGNTDKRSQKRHGLICLALIGLSWLEFTVFPFRHFNQLYFYGIACFELLYLARNALSSSALAPFLARAGNVSLWIFLTHYVLQQEMAYYLGKYTSSATAPFLIDLVIFSVASTALCYWCALICDWLYRGFSAWLSNKFHSKTTH